MPFSSSLPSSGGNNLSPSPRSSRSWRPRLGSSPHSRRSKRTARVLRLFCVAPGAGAVVDEARPDGEPEDPDDPPTRDRTDLFLAYRVQVRAGSSEGGLRPRAASSPAQLTTDPDAAPPLLQSPAESPPTHDKKVWEGLLARAWGRGSSSGASSSSHSLSAYEGDGGATSAPDAALGKHGSLGSLAEVEVPTPAEVEMTGGRRQGEGEGGEHELDPILGMDEAWMTPNRVYQPKAAHPLPPITESQAALKAAAAEVAEMRARAAELLCEFEEQNRRLRRLLSVKPHHRDLPRVQALLASLLPLDAEIRSLLRSAIMQSVDCMSIEVTGPSEVAVRRGLVAAFADLRLQAAAAHQQARRPNEAVLASQLAQDALRARHRRDTWQELVASATAMYVRVCRLLRELGDLEGLAPIRVEVAAALRETKHALRRQIYSTFSEASEAPSAPRPPPVPLACTPPRSAPVAVSTPLGGISLTLRHRHSSSKGGAAKSPGHVHSSSAEEEQPLMMCPSPNAEPSPSCAHSAGFSLPDVSLLGCSPGYGAKRVHSLPDSAPERPQSSDWAALSKLAPEELVGVELQAHGFRGGEEEPRELSESAHTSLRLADCAAAVAGLIETWLQDYTSKITAMKECLEQSTEGASSSRSAEAHSTSLAALSQGYMDVEGTLNKALLSVQWCTCGFESDEEGASTCAFCTCGHVLRWVDALLVHFGQCIPQGMHCSK